MITKCGIRQLKKYCREPIENIKGYREAVESEARYDCHHINELTFTSDELKRMNMYYHRPASELILLKASDHIRLHRRHDMPSALYGENNGMYGRTGEKAPMYGRTGEKCPMHDRTGNKNHMYGRTGEKCPNWKGDRVKPCTIYMRARKLYQSGQISEEEFQKFRDAKREYERQRRKLK